MSASIGQSFINFSKLINWIISPLLMKQIILDTNMLLVPAQLGVDIYREIHRLLTESYELVTFEENMRELGFLAARSTTLSKAVQITKKLTKSKGLKTLPMPPNCNTVDDAILAFAQPGNSIVATLDAELKQRLKAKHIQIITVRQKKYLVIEE